MRSFYSLFSGLLNHRGLALRSVNHLFIVAFPTSVVFASPVKFYTALFLIIYMSITFTPSSLIISTMSIAVEYAFRCLMKTLAHPWTIFFCTWILISSLARESFSLHIDYTAFFFFSVTVIPPFSNLVVDITVPI